MKRQVLVVSPTPTHPAVAGNRKRISTMLKTLQEMGAEITFVLDDQERAGGHTGTQTDYEGMKEEWNRFYRVQDFSFPDSGKGGPALRIMQQAGSFLKKYLYSLYEFLAPAWMNLRMLLFRESESGKVLDRRPSSIDCRYNPLLSRVLEELYRNHSFDSMLVEYVFMSRALLGFPGSNGIIDTHDVFSGRTEKLRKRKVKNTFFDTSPEQEGKGLDRAQAVIAIQEEEAEFFRKITSARVVTVGHLTPYLGNGDYPGNRKSLLFVGAANAENIEGLNSFVENVFVPLVVKGMECRLFVAGSVGKHLRQERMEIIRLGEVEDLAEAYRMADLTVSPINVGTGLKIKIIESFAYGVPVIGTSHSLAGVPPVFRECQLAVDSDREFREQMINLLEFPERLKQMHRSCRNSVEEYYWANMERMRELFFEPDS